MINIDRWAAGLLHVVCLVLNVKHAIYRFVVDREREREHGSSSTRCRLPCGAKKVAAEITVFACSRQFQTRGANGATAQFALNTRSASASVFTTRSQRARVWQMCVCIFNECACIRLPLALSFAQHKHDAHACSIRTYLYAVQNTSVHIGVHNVLSGKQSSHPTDRPTGGDTAVHNMHANVHFVSVSSVQLEMRARWFRR